MKFQLMGDWPHGAITIPAGAEIVGEVGSDGTITVTYNHMPLRLPLPLNAKAMDAEAAAMMRKWYGRELWHLLLFGPGIT
jgi:hypothetical protein